VTTDALTDYLVTRRADHIRRIQELVRQPSVSPERRGCREFAHLLSEQYAALGCAEVRVVDAGDDWPGIWGYYDAAAEHTIACYAYFDTYGVQDSSWDFPPFGGVVDIIDGFPEAVIGRGATVKGSHCAWLGALEAVFATGGSLPVNVLFLTEGAEMMGSPNFGRICDDAAAYLSSVSAFLSPRMSEERGSREIPVSLGYKNMVTFDLECRAQDWGRGPRGGTVYGNAKSIIDSPTHRLIQALASMLAPDGNHIAIDGLEHVNSVRKELSAEERELVGALLRRFGAEPWSSVLPTAAGVDQWAGDLHGDAVLSEYLYGPSINISEIRSAGVANEPQLTMLLPDSAKASVELRMVTDMPAAEIISRVRRHLVAHGFPEITVIPYGLWNSLQISATEPIVRAAIQTLENYRRIPVLWPIQPFGGPWAGIPRRLGVPSLSGCSLGYGANGGGAPNEYIVIESAVEGRGANTVDGAHGAADVAGLVEAERFMCDLLLNAASALDQAGGVSSADAGSC
jgi:acetylornithine deacetylase/succinyl-diaminopimelate desuccinylase-like protein